MDQVQRELGEISVTIKELSKKLDKIDSKLENVSLEDLKLDVNKLKSTKNFERGVVASIVFIIVYAKEFIYSFIYKGLH